MHYAHEKGVIHRDLKPSNIMMHLADGTVEPVIVDFGLARCIEPGSARLTASGLSIGTWQYMTPEQLCGEPDALGPGCDIYALGVIMYELLTGRLPFDAAGQVVRGNPAPPSSCRADVDPRLEAICLKAMAASSAARYASMGDLASALTDYLRSSPATAGPGNLVPNTVDEAAIFQAPTAPGPLPADKAAIFQAPTLVPGPPADGTPAQRVRKATRITTRPVAAARETSVLVQPTGRNRDRLRPDHHRNRVLGGMGSSRAYCGRNPGRPGQCAQPRPVCGRRESHRRMARRRREGGDHGQAGDAKSRTEERWVPRYGEEVTLEHHGRTVLVARLDPGESTTPTQVVHAPSVEAHEPFPPPANPATWFMWAPNHSTAQASMASAPTSFGGRRRRGRNTWAGMWKRTSRSPTG